MALGWDVAVFAALNLHFGSQTIKKDSARKAPSMDTLDSSSPHCRHCRYYTPEGRRGGHCQRLNVMVQSHWKACSVAAPPFMPAWENLEGIIIWQQQAISAHHHQHPLSPAAKTESFSKDAAPFVSDATSAEIRTVSA